MPAWWGWPGQSVKRCKVLLPEEKYGNSVDLRSDWVRFRWVRRGVVRRAAYHAMNGLILAGLLWQAVGNGGTVSGSGVQPFTWTAIQDASNYFGASSCSFTSPAAGRVRVFLRAGNITGWQTNTYAAIGIRTNGSAAALVSIGLAPLGSTRGADVVYLGLIGSNDVVTVAFTSVQPSYWTGGGPNLSFSGEWEPMIETVQLASIGTDAHVFAWVFFGFFAMGLLAGILRKIFRVISGAVDRG